MKIVKTVLTVLFLQIFLLTGKLQASEIKILNHIPERYILVVFSDEDPWKPLNKEKIIASARKQLEDADVEQCQFVVYDKGKKIGDGMRAMGEMWKEHADTINWEEPTENRGKFLEECLGYTTTPRDLYMAYKENEVVADDDFKGKIVLFETSVERVSKDFFGNPYLNIAVDEYGIFGLHVFLDSKDPFLRKIRKGSTVVIHGKPKGFIVEDVILDGKIIMGEGFILLNGKAVPIGQEKQ